MSSERIFRAIGDVGDDLIARADRPAQKHAVWLRWGALAACCALVIGLAALALPQLGFGAASADSAAADSTAEFSTTAGENAKSASGEAAEATTEEAAAVTEDPAPAAIEPQMETDEMESMYEAPAEDAVASDTAPAEAAQGTLPLLARDCAKIVLRYDGASVAVTDTGEVDEVMQALRALPLTREDVDAAADGDTDGQILQLYLYEADAQAYYAFVELPRMRVVGADELEGGGETAIDYRSEAAKALYDALVARYFDE